MKINLKKEKDSFKPMTLEIQIETREEAEKFYNIFNHVQIAGNPYGIGEENAEKIRELLRPFYNKNTFKDFANFI